MRDPNLAPTPIQALQRELRARAAELDASARHIERFYNDPDRLQDWLSRDPNAAQDLAHQRVVANAEAEQRARMAEAYAQQARQQAAVAAARQQHQQQHLPSLHRVYVIRCASCDTFLSDRGMRVSFSSIAFIGSWSSRVHSGSPAVEAKHHLVFDRCGTVKCQSRLARMRGGRFLWRTDLRMPHDFFVLPWLRLNNRM